MSVPPGTQNDLQQKFNLALSDLQHGNLDAAQASFAELLSVVPGDADILSLMASVAAQKGEAERSVSLLKKAIELHPGNTMLHYNLGTHYFELFRYEEAVDELQGVLSIDAAHAAAAFNLGKALQALGRFDEAARAYAQSLKNRPGYPKAIRGYAECLYAGGHDSEGFKVLQDAVATYPGEADLQFSYGFELLRKRSSVEAIDAFDAALSASPWHVLSAAFKGTALRETGDDTGANVADGFDRIQEVGDFSQRFTDSDKNSLIAAVAGHPSVTWERPNTSTVSGGQTANLVNDADAAIGRFVTALTTKVDSIVHAMAENPSCLFTRHVP